ncbi:MAG: bifunctional glutamate N-acetyltransferase/amino-acid acetyltransferase ArgJ [Dehalococcoidia bacterium]|nr:bifunctional glutamate N-acetyltransferase/amino-acid acetyltransferase ArgJ [Dehalococcoidia bacterium]
MHTDFTFIENGTVTSPSGFTAGAAYAGINKHARFNLDTALLASAVPCHAVGVFTTSGFKAAAVVLCQSRVPSSSIRGIVVNSGCANAGTGEYGEPDAQNMLTAAADRLGIDAFEMLIASTGVIGKRLPLEALKTAIASIKFSSNGGDLMAKAIMTTDTIPKQCAVVCGGYTIGGVAKGSGMIHPDMATMLSFITTDAVVETGFLQHALREAVNKSFNMISVDGDTSPSDSVILLANGLAGGETITAGSEEAACFQQALDALCIYLAKAVARDGEGATKLMEVTVKGAASAEDARQVARVITTSPLVKTAVHGCDPNWGRIVAAAGRSGAAFVLEKLSLAIGGALVLSNGQPVPADNDELVRVLGGSEVKIELDLNLGSFAAIAWGCDLSAEYVSINADYTT